MEEERSFIPIIYDLGLPTRVKCSRLELDYELILF